MNFKTIACDKDCRFQTCGFVESCMYFPPQYDKEGNNLNPDRNNQSGSVKCLTCEKEWSMHKRVCDQEWEFSEQTDAG